MENVADYEQSMLPQSDSSPLVQHPKLKRLKNKSTEGSATSSDVHLVEPDELETENEWDDGLDPLFGEGDQIGGAAKRVLEFPNLGQDLDLCGDGLSDADFDGEDNSKREKRPPSSEESGEKKEKKKRRTKKSEGGEKSEKKKSAKSVGSDGKPKFSKRKKEDREAHLAQLADFQRVMRERKGVGFKPVAMVQKPISSVLEKIRQRKMEVSKKLTASRSAPLKGSLDVMIDSDPKDDYTLELLGSTPDKAMSGAKNAESPVMDASPNASPIDAVSKPRSIDKQTPIQMPLKDEGTQSFRAPVNDTQDCFSDSQTNDTPDDQSIEESDNPAEEKVAPLLPSLNLKFDSALPDAMSSDEEEINKKNIEPNPQPLPKGNSSLKGDPVREFVDEEALEDDSDDDLLHLQDDDEGDNADMEEIHDYIINDYKEKAIDLERRNQLHQMWLQQQDEAGTENLLHRLNHGVKQREPSLLEHEDDREEDESDHEGGGGLYSTSGPRVSTKRLKQMIPQMFTDEDDGFVSSEDEETERRFSKQKLLQNLELEEQSKLFSPAEDETSREVFGRIKKLNKVSDIKKKAKTSSCFDTLHTIGGSNSSKSSFLRRASSCSVTSSHRNASTTGRSFIFGREDSNSRSSILLPEDLSAASLKESQVKRNGSAKFISSQAKCSNQHTEDGETASGSSLFEILKHSSMQTCHSTRDSLVDHQAVFAAFKSVKKPFKIEGRS